MISLLLHLLVALAQTPYNIRLFESFLPVDTAKTLAQSQTFEYHYIGNDLYLCELPESEARTPAPLPPNEPDLVILDSAVKLIQDSFSPDSCIWAYDLRRSYWTYAFCNGDKIIQYHEAAPPSERGKTHLAQQPNHVFVLGRFSRNSGEILFENQVSPLNYEHYVKNEARRTATLKDEVSSPFSHSLAQKAVLQIITDGSVCDMTGQPRTIEVVYKCDSSMDSKIPEIIDVLEIKVCHYKLFIHIPNLCTHESFVPDKYVQDHLVDVNCQRIDDNNEVKGAFFDFRRTVLRDHAFPVRADNRINIADHYLAPMNRGFYMARSKRAPETNNPYVKHRNVILFNGAYESLLDLNMQFAQSVINCIGTKLIAPGGEEQMLEWHHTFAMYFEIYDYKGEFIGLSKISHDASRKERAVAAAVLDPRTLLDNEGDTVDLVKFERPDFQAPHDMWNFQLFDEEGNPLKRRDEPPLEMESRLLIVHNRGTENGRVKIEVVDEETGNVLQGKYRGHEYVFTIEYFPGRVVEYQIKPIETFQEFYGFRVEVPVVKLPDQKNSGSDVKDSETTSKSELLENNSENSRSKQPEQKDSDAVEASDFGAPETTVDAQDRLSKVLSKIVEENEKRHEKTDESKHSESEKRERDLDEL